MAILLGLSSLPFLNELITNENDGSLLHWIASAEKQKGWKDGNGHILQYSKFRVMLFYLLGQTAIFIASMGWFSVAKGKFYRNALLLCGLSSAYHIFLILSENRKTWLNEPDLKLLGTLVVALVLFGGHVRSEIRKRKALKGMYSTLGTAPKKIVTVKVVLVWIAFYVLSTFPYLHDIISPRGQGIQTWVPFDGFVEFVELGEGNYWGFKSYRALVLTLFIQLFAQTVWAGWWMDAKYSLYKPFILIPLGLSLYELTLIIMVQQDTYLNKPDLKLALILGLAAIIGVVYYFKNEGMAKKPRSITDVVPQNRTYKNT